MHHTVFNGIKCRHFVHYFVSKCLFLIYILCEPLALKDTFQANVIRKRRHDHHDNNIAVKMVYNYKVIFSVYGDVYIRTIIIIFIRSFIFMTSSKQCGNRVFIAIIIIIIIMKISFLTCCVWQIREMTQRHA